MPRLVRGIHRTTRSVAARDPPDKPEDDEFFDGQAGKIRLPPNSL
jgi:hypothetical protein